jgi:uncharacterized repeat protein (TIGR01451 family)
MTARRQRERTTGQSLVEFALVLPILLVFFAAAADLGRMFYTFVAIQNAAKEGALYGARYPLCDAASSLCPDPDNVTWRVQEESPTLREDDGTPVDPVVRCVAPSGVARTDFRQCVPGDTYVVGVHYQFNLITPILSSMLGDGVSLNTQSTAVVVNRAFDPNAGIGVTKLVDATNANNAAEVAASCTEPDPSGSPGFYRAPCQDVNDNDVAVEFDTGDTITYKVILRNVGSVNLSSVTLTDSLGWPTTCSPVPSNIASGSSPYTCTYSRTATTSGDLTNTVTATAAEITSVADSAVVSVTQPPVTIMVTKWLSPYKDGADGDGLPSFGTVNNLTVYRNTLVPNATVWFRVRVENTGGATVNNLVITDSRGALPYGQNTTTAACDSQPSSLAPGGVFLCRYRVTLSATGTYANTVTATASNVTAGADTTSTATAVVQTCATGSRVVPNVVGLTKTVATSAWTAAGFTGAVTSWSGSPNTIVISQNRQAYGCLASNTTLTITRTTTP